MFLSGHEGTERHRSCQQTRPFEKIGRLIKHNKIFDLSNNSNINSKSIEDSPLGIELDSIESILSDILSPSKLDTQNAIKNLNINNKEFTKSDLEEAQNLIKKCSQDEQSILISILEIQLSLVGNENNYIKYEKINDKNIEKIEKNIYWVITCEIHKRVHQEKKEFEEYCHCVKDQKEKYILGSEYNFKYENIDSTICKLKSMNKNIEFIAIKSVFISFYNMTCEFIQKYLEIIEYNKKNKTNEYFIFDYIINDYIYIIDKIKFLNSDFKQSLDCFINTFHINFSFENLFKDIFFNSLFHNQQIGFLYIQGFIHTDSDIKVILKKILDLISNIKAPLNKNIGKILEVDNLIEYRLDLTTKILEQIEQLPICVGVGKCEIKKDEEKGEILRKKEIIYIRGKFGRNDKSNEFSENVSQINMEKIFMDLNEDDNRNIIREKIIINKIKKENKKLDIHDELEDEKEKINKNNINNNKENDNINMNNNNETTNINSNSNSNDKNEENKIINNNRIQNEIKNNNDSNNDELKNKGKSEKDKMDMENKSIEEIYEYINKDNKVKNKKKNKKKNKANRLKKNKNKNEIYDSSINIPEDPLVVQFKNDLKEDFIFANTITKIKPFISENWIKTITSY